MGLPVVRTGNVALDRFLEQVREYIETSKGGGNPQSKDRVLRVSDLSSVVALAAAGAQNLPKKYTQSEMEKFADDLRNTRVFQSLMSEGSALGNVVDGIPRQTLADVRAARGAGMASVVSEAIVSAEANRTVAAQVDTVTARLDGFDGTASIETAYLALVDRVTGAEAQYTVKVTAGGAVAGFGLAATDPVGGTPSSAFIVAADKFAVVSPSYAGGLTNSPNLANIPFGVDASGVYINGTVRINAGGAAIEDGITGPAGATGPAGPAGATGATGSPGANGVRGPTRTVRTIAGSTWSDAEANTAISTFGSVVLRDEVTLRNSDTAPTYVETRYWSGFAWASVGVTINGNLLVSGSITSDKVAANAITADKISSTAILANQLKVEKVGGSPVGNITVTNPITGGSMGGTSWSVSDWSSTPGGIFSIGAVGKTSGGSSYQAGLVGQATGTGGNTSVGVIGVGSSSGPSYGGVFSGGSFDVSLKGSGKLDWNGVSCNPPTGTGTLYLRNDGTWQAGTAAANLLALNGAFVGNPGTAFTHYISITANGTTMRIPVFYP